MSDDDAITTPPNGTPAPIDESWSDDRLEMIGFTDEERASLHALGDLPHSVMTMFALLRVAERVEAMEKYLRAKIMADRKGGRIVSPYKN